MKNTPEAVNDMFLAQVALENAQFWCVMLEKKRAQKKSSKTCVVYLSDYVENTVRHMRNAGYRIWGFD